MIKGVVAEGSRNGGSTSPGGGGMSILSKGAVVGGCEHEARGAGNGLMGKYQSRPRRPEGTTRRPRRSEVSDADARGRATLEKMHGMARNAGPS